MCCLTFLLSDKWKSDSDVRVGTELRTASFSATHVSVSLHSTLWTVFGSPTSFTLNFIPLFCMDGTDKIIRSHETTSGPPLGSWPSRVAGPGLLLMFGQRVSHSVVGTMYVNLLIVCLLQSTALQFTLQVREIKPTLHRFDIFRSITRSELTHLQLLIL